ncbi:hypothetical protein EJB05_31067, partial [Eragrostis curvula]
MHTATFLIVKPEFREAFSSLQTNEGRFDLLEREHENEELKRKIRDDIHGLYWKMKSDKEDL